MMLLLLMMMIMVIIVQDSYGRILHRFGFKPVMLINGGLSILSIIACALISPAMPIPIIFAVLFLNGVFRSMQFTSINTLGFADLSSGQISSASAITSASMQLSNTLGVALASLGLVIAHSFANSQSVALTLRDFHLTFIFIAFISFMGLICLLKLPANAGESIRKS